MGYDAVSKKVCLQVRSRAVPCLGSVRDRLKRAFVICLVYGFIRQVATKVLPSRAYLQIMSRISAGNRNSGEFVWLAVNLMIISRLPKAQFF